ncbi:MAG: endonuclease III [Erysipelotrichaceae bacterium]|nr:endonuclease III [Erysipelotrichaceae bacterium]
MISKKAERVLLYLNEILPIVGCELNYHKDYELLIAVVLSAQTTDKSVNQVTPKLFSKYQSLEELANADIKDVEEIIKSIGLYKAKAKNIVNLAKELVSKYDSKVPSDKDVLVTLPGVGNKTAGVTRLELFKADELPVDTHVARIAKRLKFASKNDEPLDIEKKLKKAFPQDKWGKLHHQFIHFGRYYCTAKNPKCENCKIRDFCIEK